MAKGCALAELRIMMTIARNPFTAQQEPGQPAPSQPVVPDNPVEPVEPDPYPVTDPVSVPEPNPDPIPTPPEPLPQYPPDITF
jgi:hypothetical protein